MPRKAMKVVVELDIHTVSFVGEMSKEFQLIPSPLLTTPDHCMEGLACDRSFEGFVGTYFINLSVPIHSSGDMPRNFSPRLRLCLFESKLHGFGSKYQVCGSNVPIVLPRTATVRAGEFQYCNLHCVFVLVTCGRSFGIFASIICLTFFS